MLGTFAVYGHHACLPRPEQLQVLQAAAYLAGIALDIAEQRQSERARLETAQMLNAVASQVSDAIFVKDLQGKYLFFNQAASDFVGKPIEAVIGQDDSSLFDSSSFELLQEIHHRVIETNEPYATEETLTANGVTRTYSVIKAPYRDEQGIPLGLSAFHGTSQNASLQNRHSSLAKSDIAWLYKRLRNSFGILT